MKILCVCHNTPFPPNKGDKMRSFHLLRELAREHEVHLLTLSKDPKDEVYAEELNQLFASVRVIPIHPVLSKWYALCCLLLGLPLTLGFFFSLRAKRAIRHLCAREQFDATLAICSSTAHYVKDIEAEHRIVDLIDVDSEKWRQYAVVHRFPKSLIYSLEHKRLEKVERAIHQRTSLTIVTSDIERERLMKIADCDSARIMVIPQGVALDFYAERRVEPKPKRIVFTGQMDYLPNIDGILFFYTQVFPKILAEEPEVELYIVGRNPSEELRALCPQAHITGEVEDIREYLHTASVVVAPLRLAFGMQSKILEAMASSIPVVASDKAAQSLWVEHDRELLVAETALEFADYTLDLLKNAERASSLAAAARHYVGERHHWRKIMRPLLCRLSRKADHRSGACERCTNREELSRLSGIKESGAERALTRDGYAQA